MTGATETAVDPQPPAIIVTIVPRIDAYLDAWLSARDLPTSLLDAVRYSVLGGGKRLRPVLTALCCDAVGGSIDAALPPGGALELIHCFSLVHDDLPAMDDDDVRRGRPTLHIHAGEAMAILAGDAMMSLAFEMVIENQPPDACARLVQELAHGTTLMIAGQVFDTMGGFPEGLTPREQLDLIHRNKTAALIRAACRLGAIAGGADDATVEALTTYGERIGLMFQIVDDVVDVTQSADHAGKATGKDSAAGKITFPGVVGLEESRREIAQLHEAATAALSPLGDRGHTLIELSRYLSVRTR